MKKAFICFLILTQAAAMLCGCQTAKAPTVVGEACAQSAAQPGEVCSARSIGCADFAALR